MTQRIAVIGGGSCQWVPKLVVDIANTPTASVGTLPISNVVLNGTGGLFRADSGGALPATFESATTSAGGKASQRGMPRPAQASVNPAATA